jgi:hypothetical protein
MAKASRGRITEQDIIKISGKSRHDSAAKFETDPMWDAEPDDLRQAIWRKAAAAARKQVMSGEQRAKGGESDEVQHGGVVWWSMLFGGNGCLPRRQPK